MTGFAVMEDDTVLCADCVHEICDERLPATGVSMVHTWLAVGSGQSCRWCAATDDREEGGSWVVNVRA